MAEFKRRTLILSTGKQLKLFGNSLAIGKSFEVGEGGAPTIFSCFEQEDSGKTNYSVANPYKLTAEELHEIADYNIRLWIDFKDSIRQHGINSTKIFNVEKPAENNVSEKKKYAIKHANGS